MFSWRVQPMGHGRTAERIEAHDFDVTPAGALIFKDDRGNFIKAFGVGGWISVEPIKGQ